MFNMVQLPLGKISAKLIRHQLPIPSQNGFSSTVSIEWSIWLSSREVYK